MLINLTYLLVSKILTFYLCFISFQFQILDNGVPGIDSAIAKRPILGSYLPIHPVDRFTNKKWDLGDWARHNENKYFQAQRDRDRSTT